MAEFALSRILFIDAVDQRRLPSRFEDCKTNVMPKAPVAFELRLGKPLVGRAVMGKHRVLIFVVEDIGGFVAAER